MTALQRQTRGESVADLSRRLDEEKGYTNTNVAPSERVLSGIGGAALVVAGLRRGSPGGLAMSIVGGLFLYRAATGYCGTYAALGLDSAHEGHALFGGHDLHKDIYVRKTFTVNRSPGDCYTFWRDFQNLPRFMTHLKSVSVLDAKRSRWEARSPTGGTVAWDAEIFNERPNELIAWKSVADADIDNAGSVRFRAATGNRGTEVTVELMYKPPAGRLGAAVAWLLGEEPDIQVREDLRRFKQIMETGETPTIFGQPACRGGHD
jgi:uncharacterized membrane protein